MTTPSDATVERVARAICDAWGYDWDGDPEDSQTAPEIAPPYDDRPDKRLYREAARQAIAAITAEDDPDGNRWRELRRIVEGSLSGGVDVALRYDDARLEYVVDDTEPGRQPTVLDCFVCPHCNGSGFEPAPEPPTRTSP
jgi:hypothetical protein